MPKVIKIGGHGRRPPILMSISSWFWFWEVTVFSWASTVLEKMRTWKNSSRKVRNEVGKILLLETGRKNEKFLIWKTEVGKFLKKFQVTKFPTSIRTIQLQATFLNSIEIFYLPSIFPTSMVTFQLVTCHFTANGCCETFPKSPFAVKWRRTFPTSVGLVNFGPKILRFGLSYPVESWLVGYSWL